MRHHLYVHLVWTTRDREPSIDARLASFLEPYVRRVCLQERAEALAVGIVRTHVHVLLRIDPQTALSRLIQRLKGGSARLATAERHTQPRGLSWAKGYNLHSVSPRAVDIVRHYVTHQSEQHPDEAIER
jgi:REP element-mobilizing transposase RayT